MENAALLVLLESVLGSSHKTSKGNYAFTCPFCHHHKPKLEINLRTTEKKENPWHCWVCGAKGKTLRALFKKIEAPQNKIKELNLLVVPSKKEEYIHVETLTLPAEFISLNDISKLDKLTQIEAKHALKYLKKRNITQEDIILGFVKKVNMNFV